MSLSYPGFSRCARNPAAPYTHLRAYQLVSKLDARRRQTQKIAPYFVPYPAEIETTSDVTPQFTITLSDFESLKVTAPTRLEALRLASGLLLRTLASAAQKGERVPTPGELHVDTSARVMVCPLNPDYEQATVSKPQPEKLPCHIYASG